MRTRVYYLSLSISQAINGAQREPPQHFAAMADDMINSFIKDGGCSVWGEPAQITVTVTDCGGPGWWFVVLKENKSMKLTSLLMISRIAASNSSELLKSTVKTCGLPMCCSAYGCWEDTWGTREDHDHDKTLIDSTDVSRCGLITFLEVGFPLKKLWFRELWGGLNLGCRKMQPLAMASKGAGPSYGKPNPINN